MLTPFINITYTRTIHHLSANQTKARFDIWVLHCSAAHNIYFFLRSANKLLFILALYARGYIKNYDYLLPTCQVPWYLNTWYRSCVAPRPGINNYRSCKHLYRHGNQTRVIVRLSLHWWICERGWLGNNILYSTTINYTISNNCKGWTVLISVQSQIKLYLFFYFFYRFGNLNQWWNNITIGRFKERAKCIQEQYSSYSMERQNLNGKQTLGKST